ncbi:unnamed protein product, partial [Choristocarpus tenellus]
MWESADPDRKNKGGSVYWDDLTPADTDAACLCGRDSISSRSWGADLCWIQCDICKWWLHGGCCGFTTQEAVDAVEEESFICVVCKCLTLIKAPQVCCTFLFV